MPTLGLSLLLAVSATLPPDDPKPGDPARFLRIGQLRTQLTKGMKREDRLSALRGLMLVRPPALEAVPDLVAALTEEDEFVRSYAALALLSVDQRRSKEALAVLTPLFADKSKPSAVLRDTTLFLELGQVRPAHPDLVAGLLALLRGDHPLGQVAAYQALQHLDPTASAAAPPLRSALTDPRARLRLVAAEGLARVAPAETASSLKTLEGLLTVPEKGVRGEAALALVRLDPASTKKGVLVLRSLFLDPAFQPGRTMTRQLLDLDVEQADVVIPILSQGLQDGDARARLTALRDLAVCGRLGATQEAAVRQHLGDANLDVARTAAEVLVLAHPPLARSFLPDVLGRDRDFSVFRILDQLDRLTAQEDFDRAIQDMAERAGGKEGENDRVHAVARLQTLSRLAEHGPAARGAVPRLTQLLTDLSDPQRRDKEILGELLASQTIYALGRIGPPAGTAAPVLLKLARSSHTSPALRVEAMAALKGIDPEVAGQADLP